MKYENLATEIGRLVDEKNKAYGDSFAKSGAFLRLLYPNGLAPEQYGDALLLVRIFDKQMRIATDAGAFGESPYRDIAGYGILGAQTNGGAEDIPDVSAFAEEIIDDDVISEPGMDTLVVGPDTWEYRPQVYVQRRSGVAKK